MAVFAKFSGLHTSNNYVGSVPDGALETADNCMISSEDTVEPRRGQYPLTYAPGAASDRVNVLLDNNGTLVAQYGSTLAYDTGAAFTAYGGTATPFDDTSCRMRGVAVGTQFYVNTYDGTLAPDEGGTLAQAGHPQCLDVYEFGGTTSAAGILANDRAVAYRAVASRTGDVEIEGAPSQRTIVTNPDISVPIGALVRAANVVTVQLQASDPALRYLAVANSITLSTNEANFLTGVKTIASVDTANNRFTYAEVAANATSSIAHTFKILARSSKLAVGYPVNTDFVKLYRTEIAAAASVDPGDETYQIDEAEPPAAQVVAIGGVIATGTSVVVTKNGHPFVVGQTVEIQPGETNLPSGCNVITATTANTFTYVDPTAANQTSTAAQTFTARTVVFEDVTPDALLGDPAYWNPNTGDGLESSKYEPPSAQEMCWFGNRMWWANHSGKHRFDLEMIGVGSPDGVQNNDTLTITVNGTARTYTATTSGTTPTNRKFQIYTHETPELNIESTAYELIRCINQDETSCPYFAVYNSVQDDLPGRILLVAKGNSGINTTEQMTVIASRAASWSPILPTSSNNSFDLSLNGAQVAELVWSEEDEPEAVPLANRLVVAQRDMDSIRRIHPLREHLFVFKDSGLYVVPNQTPFRYRELDLTCKLIAIDTVVALNNQLWALTEQGLVSINESGVDVVGWPLDYDFRSLRATSGIRINSTSARMCFAVAYESEHQLWLWLPSASTDTYATQAYVYNTATRAFTRQVLSRRCGLVTYPDILYSGSATSNSICRERKNYDDTDYADETYSVTLDAMSGTACTLSSTANVEAGDLLDDGAGHTGLVTDVNGTVATINIAADFVVGDPVTVYKGYEVEVTTVPLTLGEPGSGKHISRAVYSFRNAQFQLANATISTDDEPSTTEYEFDQSGYGGGSYGGGGYGSPAEPHNKYVTLGTTGAFVKLGLKIREARSKWKLLALTAQIDAQSERGR